MEDLAVPRRPRFPRRRTDPQDLIATTIAEHADALLRLARRHATCDDDAEEAYQRAMEIFVRSAHRLDPRTAHRWLHSVVKHESWAVTEARGRLVGVDDGTLEVLDDGRCELSLHERSERLEEMTRVAEALQRLKPQEVTALVLKAQGLSYQEIAARNGWTYTKVNRCLAEGRKAFLIRYRGIEAGEECERWLPVLSALADGEATPAQLVDARPHLRNCPACRSVLGDLHRVQAPIAALLPPVAVAGGPGILDRLGDLVVGLQERAVALHAAVETASGAKLAAVAASTAALAGGGVAVERTATPDPRPPVAAAQAAAQPERRVPAPAPAATTTTAAPAAAAPADEPVGRPAAREPEPERPTGLARDGSPEFDAGAPAEAPEFAAEATATAASAARGAAEFAATPAPPAVAAEFRPEDPAEEAPGGSAEFGG